jgi:hypothetical protein
VDDSGGWDWLKWWPIKLYNAIIAVKAMPPYVTFGCIAITGKFTWEEENFPSSLGRSVEAGKHQVEVHSQTIHRHYFIGSSTD